MTIDENSPTLDFFRATPRDMVSQAPLASSLQSFETCLFLIGLDRFPGALVSCASAWESALKAKLAIGPEERSITLGKMTRRTNAFLRCGGSNLAALITASSSASEKLVGMVIDVGGTTDLRKAADASECFAGYAEARSEAPGGLF